MISAIKSKWEKQKMCYIFISFLKCADFDEPPYA